MLRMDVFSSSEHFDMKKAEKAAQNTRQSAYSRVCSERFDSR
jgi:hypothetical protein